MPPSRRSAGANDAPVLALLEEVEKRPVQTTSTTTPCSPLGDRHLGLGDCPVARDVDGGAAQEVQDADALGPAFLATAMNSSPVP